MKSTKILLEFVLVNYLCSFETIWVGPRGRGVRVVSPDEISLRIRVVQRNEVSWEPNFLVKT